MTNCNHKNQRGNFCGNCGTQLKDKCECGDMEWIGRKICKAREREAQDSFDAYFDQKKKVFVAMQRYGLFIALMIGIITGSYLSILITKADFYNQLPHDWLRVCFFLLAFLIPYLTFPLSFVFIGLHPRFTAYKKREADKLRAEFCRLHPEYAEILEHEKGTIQ